MTFKEINKQFTEKVAEYMAKGYTLNAGTMSGSQGEVAHVDLTDGTEIIRIVVEDFRDGDWNQMIEGIRIVVGWCSDGCKPNVNKQFETIWNNHLEILEEIKFYRVNSNRRNAWYVDDPYEAADIRVLQAQRQRKKLEPALNKEEDITTDRVIDVVVPYIRKERHIQKVNRSQVKVFKCIRNGGQPYYKVHYLKQSYVLR